MLSANHFKCPSLPLVETGIHPASFAARLLLGRKKNLYAINIVIVQILGEDSCLVAKEEREEVSSGDDCGLGP